MSGRLIRGRANFRLTLSGVSSRAQPKRTSIAVEAGEPPVLPGMERVKIEWVALD
jgi:hypothetical protein